MNVPFLDDSCFPVGLGNPLRVPHYAWENWEIIYKDKDSFQTLIDLSEKYYRDEWELTTEGGHKEIREASKRAGFDNFPLNEENGKIAAKIIKSISGKSKILDVGAGTGGTTIEILKALGYFDKRNLHFTLIDPAKKALEEAKNRLVNLGLQYGEHFTTITVPDFEMERYLEPMTYDLATSVAAIHHHAYLTRPFACVYNLLKHKGFFLTSDWHNSMWEHPAKVLELLTELNWVSKEEDIIKFVQTYPRALDKIPKESRPEDKIANNMIKYFWKAYASIRIKENNQFFILEGHRPAQRYVEEMKNVGFEILTPDTQKIIDQNPYQILPGSTLLMVTLGQKV
jgi:SAM-dependent methyltransferase